MTPEERKRIAELAHQIQSENDMAKLLPLMEELSELLGEKDAEQVLLRAGKSSSQ